MLNLKVKEIQQKQDDITRLKDLYQVLSISISLANGMVWKDKTKSFYEVIAKEIKAFFEENLIKNLELQKFKNEYLKITIDNKSLIFLKNNLFRTEDKKYLNQEEWLKQRLVFLEKKELPSYLEEKEKYKMLNDLDDRERKILNDNYNRQELNSNKFSLNLIEKDKIDLINILTKYNCFSITVEEYIDMLVQGKYDYNNLSDDYIIKVFKNTYNNYILEIGAYIAKCIENYLNER